MCIKIQKNSLMCCWFFDTDQVERFFSFMRLAEEGISSEGNKFQRLEVQETKRTVEERSSVFIESRRDSTRLIAAS